MKEFLIFFVCLLVGVNGNSGRIAGGEVAEGLKYPFAASLVTNGGQGTSYTHGCGGTIVRINAVLTAASCFYTNTEVQPASWWRVRVGSRLSNAQGTIYFVNRITPHPDFSPTSLANDIAVVRTTLAMALVPGSVEVARVSGAAYTFATNQPVVAIGWGATSSQDSSPSVELREVQIWTVEQTTCANRWSELSVAVTSNMVCTGWLDVGVRGQCPGDNGSPLLDEQGGFVVGVFSRSQGCAGIGWYPDINTRLAPYLSWIVNAAY